MTKLLIEGETKAFVRRVAPYLLSTETPKAEEPKLMYLEQKLAQLTRRATSGKSIVTLMRAI